jgi:tRNA 2-thiouridine synthesizing protein A
VTRQRRVTRPADVSAPPSGKGTRSPDRGVGVTPKPALTLDALGKKCPIPIIMLADRIREIPVGQTIEVLADDPAAKTDLPAWCALKSQEFVSAADLPVGWSFLVRRSY